MVLQRSALHARVQRRRWAEPAWVGWVHSGQLVSGNKRAGFAARFENASLTFTSNRVEWNHEENMVVQGQGPVQAGSDCLDRTSGLSDGCEIYRVGLPYLRTSTRTLPSRPRLICTDLSRMKFKSF
jgi:hypothetical protein